MRDDERDDRVLPVTRAVSAAIVPFLLVAFVVLFGWPDRTRQLFAWTIRPAFTPMLLGSVYLGGAYFFVRAARAVRWHTVKAGFVPVGTFATLMGVATVIHWDRFNHHHVAFWLWAALYFTTPLLVFGVWLANRRRQVPPDVTEPRLPASVALAIGVVGVAAVGTSAWLFVTPASAIAVWPWLLTPLTCRVLGAVFSLGVAAVGAFTERSWSAIRIMVQVEMIMLTLILVAVIRASDEFVTARPLTWLLGAGFGFTLASGAVLSARMAAVARSLPPPGGGQGPAADRSTVRRRAV